MPPVQNRILEWGHVNQTQDLSCHGYGKCNSRSFQALLSVSASAALTPPLTLVMGPVDPTGATGITADAVTCARLGCHALTVATALTVQDTAGLEDVQPTSPDQLDDQARCLLEDMTVQAIKIGGVYSAETVSAVAQVAADYSQVPLVLHIGAQVVPAETSEDSDDAEDLLAATFELLIPQADVVVIDYARLAGWIADGHLRIEGLATPMHAFLAAGADWVVALGAPLRPGHTAHMLIGTTGATTHYPVHPAPERSGSAGGAVAAALTALLAQGKTMPEAVEPALAHGDLALAHGFLAGMGRRIPRHMGAA